jgi:hypothetical protein
MFVWISQYFLKIPQANAAIIPSNKDAHHSKLQSESSGQESSLLLWA